MDIFSVDFTQIWLRISETTNHATILGFQELYFKDSVPRAQRKKNSLKSEFVLLIIVGRSAYVANFKMQQSYLGKGPKKN